LITVKHKTGEVFVSYNIMIKIPKIGKKTQNFVTVNI